MNKSLFYKNYFGSAEYSAADDIFYGRVLGINDIITYEAESAAELKSAFQDSVDDYLEHCAVLGKEPGKPASSADSDRSARRAREASFQPPWGLRNY